MLVLAAFVAGALPALHEMDLGQHLANGAWIWQHRAVPFTEPYAWTRAGQPYYAYSWLADSLYYALLAGFGPVALHLLQGLVASAAAGASLWMGRQFGWPATVRLAIAVLHLVLFWGATPTLRPQQFLLITVPLAWGITARIRGGGVTMARLLALAATGALAANTHLFFPLTAAPVGYWLIADRRPRIWLLPGLALALGWLLSPYGLAWPRVFALNFGPNVMLSQPPSIVELMPGVDYARDRPGAMIAAVALLAAPWLASRAASARCERLAQALYWTVGLLLFAWAGRLVLVWWLLGLPSVAAAAMRAYRVTLARLRPRAGTVASLLVGDALLVVSGPPPSPADWAFEGGTVHRMLPRAADDAALWLPSWLLCHTRTGARGRVFTEFNYGSELNWRLPGYSPSIDGRTIFPDSIAVDFALRSAGRAARHAGTWRGAELALLDRSFWLAPVLTGDPAWVLLATAQPGAHGAGALWATREWWRRWGTTAEIPAIGVRVGDPRAVCAATGTFPR